MRSPTRFSPHVSMTAGAAAICNTERGEHIPEVGVKTL
jgi:hypothetical protein